MLDLGVVVRRYPPLAQGSLIAVSPGAFDLEDDRAVETQTIERAPHPLQPVVHQTQRLLLDSGVALVGDARGIFEGAPAPGCRTDAAFAGEPVLHRPEIPSGPEGRVAHNHRRVARSDALQPPAMPFGRILFEPFNPGHGPSPG